MSTSEHQAGDIERQDIEAALEARRELGLAFEQEVVDGFVDRIEHAVQRRVDAQVAHQRSLEKHRVGDKQRQLALGIVSLGVGIPITAITGPGMDSVVAVVVAWAGIAAVNVAHAWQTRRH